MLARYKKLKQMNKVLDAYVKFPNKSTSTNYFIYAKSRLRRNFQCNLFKFQLNFFTIEFRHVKSNVILNVLSLERLN